MKTCYYILYGYNREIYIDTFTKQIKNKNNILLIIEPRGMFIEEFKKEFKTSSNVVLISKILVSDKTKLKGDLYKVNDKYTLEQPEELNYQKREQVFCTSFSNIIDQYNIQNIGNFIITINLEKLDDLLKDFFLYYHFISKVQLQKGISFNVSSSFVEVGGIDLDNENTNYKFFENRNLDIDLPSICLYTIDYPQTEINKPKLIQMIKQFDIEVLCTNSDKLIPAEEIDDYINTISNKEKFNITHIPDRIESIIKKKYYDIIIQFNTKYFQNKPFFQLMYPLKENILYVNQGLDIIYGTGRTMYKMYEMMYSNVFKEYIKLKREQKGKLYHFFEKRYFYDYLFSKFKTIEI